MTISGFSSVWLERCIWDAEGQSSNLWIRTKFNGIMNWKTIEDFNGKFSVSDTGLIRNNETGKVLKQTVIKSGYSTVVVKPNGRTGGSKCFRVHREVALAFLPNPDNKSDVNHKDGNKINNTVENLEWVSHSANMIHAIETGLHSKGILLTESDIQQIRKEYVRNSPTHGIVALGEKYGVHNTTISNALTGRTWKHLIS